MELLKEFFESQEAKDYVSFSAWLKEKGYTLADLSKGDYVSKHKSKAELDKIKSEYEAKIKTYETDFAEYDKLITGHEGTKLQLAQLQADLTTANEQVKKEKYFNLYMRNNGNMDYAELAVEKLMRSEKEPTEAIQEFKKESPVYFQKPEIQTISTAPDVKGGDKPQTDADLERAAVRKAAGLPA